MSKKYKLERYIIGLVLYQLLDVGLRQVQLDVQEWSNRLEYIFQAQPTSVLGPAQKGCASGHAQLVQGGPTESCAILMGP
jgi:hypothetical protein